MAVQKYSNIPDLQIETEKNNAFAVKKQDLYRFQVGLYNIIRTFAPL
jgi:hypothetical protein